jgi:hypothetical protein
MQFVCIYAMIHEKRRPEYWRKRVSGNSFHADGLHVLLSVP